MKIELESKRLFYKITLKTVFNDEVTINLNTIKEIDLTQKHKTAQFLINETRAMFYNFETNELLIWFYGENKNEIRIQLDRHDSEKYNYILFLRSLFVIKGYSDSGMDSNPDVKKLFNLYHSVIYAVLFSEHTCCDDVCLDELQISKES